MRRISGIGAVAGGAWVALQALSAIRDAGAGIPSSSLAAAGVVAAALAGLAALRTASWAWRGPVIVPLPEDDVVVCCPPEAEAIRAAAQLRGTMGGAGHVHPGRLVLPAAAWASAAAAALAGPELLDAAPWIAVLAASATAALALPARAFFYREATGGRVVLHPASSREELLRSPRARAAVSGEGGAP
ncbi:MAG TPA: hypothetical protein VFL83_21370 [Anaeromyxobacter sp.]|nr:hypothetical protein [Anaeromyxobacter sp.]